jgi:hypothetical protein
VLQLTRKINRSSSAVTAFSNASTSSRILAAASASPELAFLNDLTGDVVQKSTVPSIVNHMQLSHTFLLSGSSDGYVRTHDPRSTGRRIEGGAEGSVFAHAGGVQGLQASGNYFYTIGWGFRCINCPLCPASSSDHLLGSRVLSQILWSRYMICELCDPYHLYPSRMVLHSSAQCRKRTRASLSYPIKD